MIKNNFLKIAFNAFSLIFLIFLLASCTLKPEEGKEKDPPKRDPTWIGKDWNQGKVERRDIKQSHRVHVIEMDIECWTCHRGARNSPHSGMPTMDVCADCHEVETQDDTDDKSGCLKCHTFENPNPKCTMDYCAAEDLPEIVVKELGPVPYKNLKYEVEGIQGGFSHRIHYERGIICAKCHGAIAEDGEIPFPTGKYMPKPQRCYDCHAKNLAGFSHEVHINIGKDCMECHTGLDMEGVVPFPLGKYRPSGAQSYVPEEPCKKCHVPATYKADDKLDCQKCHIANTFDLNYRPEFHDARWIEFHGRGGVVDLRDVGEHGKDCFTCHNFFTFCQKCHNTVKPVFHTNYWRNRGHGLMAAGWRERCLNCHKQDFCIRCHNETAPRFHTGSWGPPQNKHCFSGCHLADTSQPEPQIKCRVCHRSALHLEAPHPLKTANCHLCHKP